MLGVFLDSLIHLDYLPKDVWDLEVEEHSAFLNLHFDHFPIENIIMSHPSHSVSAAADNPETNVSGEQCILVVPEAEDVDKVPLQEAVSFLEIAVQVMV